MKKLLGIVVLGLLLFSCSESESNFQKKSKKIETCADFEFKKRYKDSNISKTGLYGKSLKDKLKQKRYEILFADCETYLKTNPTTFEEKYISD